MCKSVSVIPARNIYNGRRVIDCSVSGPALQSPDAVWQCREGNTTKQRARGGEGGAGTRIDTDLVQEGT